MMSRGDRVVLYRVFGGLFEQSPSTQLVGAIAHDDVLARVAQRVGGRLGDGLLAMQRHAVEVADIRADYARLFVGPKHKLAPPWESVYRCPERRVMQEPHWQVTKIYAANGVGFDGIGKRPADHVALELQFVAVMLDQEDSTADATVREFLDDHILAWVPDFSRAVHDHAETPFWKDAANSLGALCEVERTAA